MKNNKIKELKLRAPVVAYSSLSVDTEGNIVEGDVIKGYLAVWNVRDSYGTVFIKGCFAKSLSQRGPASSAKYKITMLWQHDSRDPIGQFSTLKEDDYGLYFEAKMDDEPNSLRALRQIKSGTLNQFSIGFNYIWDKMDEADNGDILLKEVELFEGSVVTIGSNSETYALRTPDQLIQDGEDLLTDTEDFIKTVPRKQQLELRQIIAKHISLAQVKPLELRQKAPDNNKPDEQAQSKPNLKNILKHI